MVELQIVNDLSISVVIPAYNAEKYLRECLDSIVNQTIEPCEIVCVDDGSSDATPSIAAEYPSVRLLVCEHRGVSAARNAGIRATSSTFVSFLDADDVWLPQKLEREITALRYGADIVHGHVSEFVSDVEDVVGIRKPTMYSTAMATSVTIRRSLLTSVGMFDETIFDTEFIDLWSRLKVMNPRIEVIDEVLVHRRIHSSNKSRQSFRSATEFLAVIRSHRRRMESE